MDATRLLWIDLCSQAAVRDLVQEVPLACATTRIDNFDRALEAMQRIRPDLVCIEFDYPDHTRLQVVTTLRRTAPALPLLMFTEYHSEALAVWAFRTGVFDYRVKPIPRESLARTIEAATSQAVFSQSRGSRPCLPADLIEPAGHLQKPPSAARKTGMAVAYITRHFHSDIRRGALAELCHLSPSEFSRTFKREHGTTFQQFLLEYRIAKARDFLTQPDATIAQAAYFAGFDDLSYFSRVFRQCIGTTASTYQRRVRLQPGAPAVR